MAVGFAIALVSAWLMVVGNAAELVPQAEVSEFLQEHGLPGGLLPDLVTSYSLSDDGAFVVHLQKECYHKFDNLVWYGKSISGQLSYGRIDRLTGIEAKELFIWLSVTGISVDKSNQDYLVFDVGIAKRKLSSSLFKEPPTCTKSASIDLIAKY